MDNSKFGILLKTLRKQQEMTQEKLASLLNVSTSTVCKWEKGANLPDVNMFQKISEILDISLDDLLNPNAALARLLSEDNKVALSPQSIEEQHIAKKAKISSKYLRIIISILIVLTLSIVGILSYLHIRENNNLSIYPYQFEIAEDEYYGTVYEVSYIYEGDIENLDVTDPFIELIGSDWQKNTEISSDIIIMKASFYPSKEAILEQSEPPHSTYFLR